MILIIQVLTYDSSFDIIYPCNHINIYLCICMCMYVYSLRFVYYYQYTFIRLLTSNIIRT